MTRKYKFFYSADVLTVVAAGDLQPIATSDVNVDIDSFESTVYALVDKNTRTNSLNSSKSNDDFISLFDEDNSDKETPNPRPLPSDDPFSPEKGIKFGQAWVYSGCKFETTFLLKDFRYRDLGLLRDEDLKSLKGKVTTRRFRTFAAAASLEVFSEAAFRIIPDDPENKTEPYGASYTTYVPYAGRLQFVKIRAVIENWTFNFGTTEAPIKYSVEPGTVKMRRLSIYNPV
jgi:hypothetical protein